MSLQETFGIRHEDIVINDEDIVLPTNCTLPEAPYLENDESRDATPELNELWDNAELSSDLDSEDAKEMNLQWYHQRLRGVIRDEVQDGMQCTTNYLEVLWYNVQLVQWFCQTQGDESPEEIDGVLDEVYDELHRLTEHPQLFPSPEIAKDFWHRLEKSLGRMSQVRSFFRERDQAYAKFIVKAAEREIGELMPQSDKSRKPWEQFLHNNAPGIGKDVRGVEQGGSIQVLPEAALRLLHNLREMQASVVRGIEAARRARGVHTPYQINNRDSNVPGVTAVSPEGHRRTHQWLQGLLDPALNGSANRVRHFGITELEKLNEDFVALSGDLPGPLMQHFNSQCIVIRDHPL